MRRRKAVGIPESNNSLRQCLEMEMSVCVLLFSFGLEQGGIGKGYFDVGT